MNRFLCAWCTEELENGDAVVRDGSLLCSRCAKRFFTRMSDLLDADFDEETSPNSNPNWKEELREASKS